MNADSFHRLAKSLLDSGEVATVSEALATFAQYGVTVRVPRHWRDDPVSQAIALTTINAASRSFSGNVHLEGDDLEITIPGFEGSRLYQFAEWCGVQTTSNGVCAAWPVIAVGVNGGDITPWADGWSFGLGGDRSGGGFFAPACVAAAGLALSEAFSILRKDNPCSGKRTVSLSLWSPEDGAARGPEIGGLPQAGLWIIGLGHLGQAYAWTISLMRPTLGPILIQDIDRVTQSSLSTSMLCHISDIGRRKTRVVAAWLEQRGYEVAIVDRRLDEHQRVGVDEPRIALVGVDNAAARRVIEGCGYRLAIDAGLGAGYRDFRALRVRAFPGPSAAADLWMHEAPQSKGLAEPYEKLIEGGADRCGVTTLATRAVGAPFVGCFAAAYVIAERLRRQLGGRGFGFLDMNLRSPTTIDFG